MMPKPIRHSLLLWLCVAVVAGLMSAPAKAPAQSSSSMDHAPAGPTKLLRFADISKDKVVFVYAGDLWIAPREGGASRRLT